MKKKNYIKGISIIAALALLTGCGSSGGNYASDGYFDMNGYDYSGSVAEKESSISFNSSKLPSAMSENKNSYNASNDIQLSEITDNRKVIKTASLRVETLEFDQYINSLNEILTKYSAYIENSNVSGNTYYNDTSARNGFFTIRVPEGYLADFLTEAGELGTITSKNYNEQDITLSYVDTEARLKTLKAEQETLLRFMNEATDINAIIEIERRLSDVNYQIESYTSQLRSFDSKINYSTVTINLFEVKRVSTIAPVQQTFSERVSESFEDGWLDFVDAFQDFVVWLSYHVFGLAVFILCVLIIIWIIAGSRRRSRKRRLKEQMKVMEKQAELNRQNAAFAAQNSTPVNNTAAPETDNTDNNTAQ